MPWKEVSSLMLKLLSGTALKLIIPGKFRMKAVAGHQYPSTNLNC